MKIRVFLIIAACALLVGAGVSAQATEPQHSPPSPEDMLARLGDEPAKNYQRYCALCHGEDRQGYANDHAPSLATKTLYGLGPIVPANAIAYGRPGTVMGPYIDDLDGPLSLQEIRELAIWLAVKAGTPMKRPSPELLEPVKGDVELGREIYANDCAECHGHEGQGGTGEQAGTALANPTMLATSPDRFLRLAIAEGRTGTPMQSFSDKLSESEIDAVTAFLRSRASGWNAGQPTASAEPPAPDEYVINPQGRPPAFELREGRYVAAEDLNAAIEDGRRLVLLDTRVPHFWAMAHIEGAVPIPYYSDFDSVVDELPNDGTWIVAYCECPRAAANSVVDKLRGRGFENTAVLWEGYAGWAALGFPVVTGQVPERQAASND